MIYCRGKGNTNNGVDYPTRGLVNYEVRNVVIRVTCLHGTVIRTLLLASLKTTPCGWERDYKLE